MHQDLALPLEDLRDPPASPGGPGGPGSLLNGGPDRCDPARHRLILMKQDALGLSLIWVNRVRVNPN